MNNKTKFLITSLSLCGNVLVLAFFIGHNGRWGIGLTWFIITMCALLSILDDIYTSPEPKFYHQEVDLEDEVQTDTGIETLFLCKEIDFRLYNLLIQFNIKSLEELSKSSSFEVKCKRGMGEKSFKKLKKVMSRHNVKFKDSP